MNKNLKQLKNSKAQNKKIDLFNKKVTSSTILKFTHDLATMLRAKIPLIEALGIIKKSAQNKNFQKVIGKLVSSIQKGQSLSESMKKFPQYFEEVYAQMISAGESADILEIVLTRQAKYLEKTINLRKKVIKALIYPAIVIFTAIVTITFLIYVIMPSFTNIYLELNAQLPESTRHLIQISSKLPIIILWITVLIALLTIIMKKLLRNNKVKLKFDQVMLKLPLISGISSRNTLVRFCRTSGTLINNGISITESLNIASKGISNLYIRKRLMKVIKDVKKGIPLSQAFTHLSFFPEVMVHIIKIGELSDSLGESLQSTADQLEEIIDLYIETFTTLIEPVLIIILGLIISMILIALYMPMFELVNVMAI